MQKETRMQSAEVAKWWEFLRSGGISRSRSGGKFVRSGGISESRSGGIF